MYIDQAKADVIREERAAIGLTRAMKSAAVGEENPAVMEKEIVTLIQNVGAL